MRDEAYVLREWWDYLHRCALLPRDVNERLIIAWMREQKRRMEKARVQRKLHIIHRYHRFLDRSGIVSSPVPEVFSEVEPKFEYPQSYLRSRPGRPTPDALEVEKVLEVLASNVNPYLAARDWLAALWMVKTGLRREGVAYLNLTAIQRCLREEGLKADGLAPMAGRPVDADRLRHSLHKLFDLGRENLFVEVIEKGPKARTVPVPIDLLLQTLEFIWIERDGLLRHSTGRYTEARSGGSIWLSLKTGQGISAQAIGDGIKKAFNTAGVRGSGHRLRAHFACRLVWKLYQQAVSNCGSGWEAGMVLLQAAEIMGHSRPETLRPYLNRVLREEAFSNVHMGSAVR